MSHLAASDSDFDARDEDPNAAARRRRVSCGPAIHHQVKKKFYKWKSTLFMRLGKCSPHISLVSGLEKASPPFKLSAFSRQKRNCAREWKKNHGFPLNSLSVSSVSQPPEEETTAGGGSRGGGGRRGGGGVRRGREEEGAQEEGDVAVAAAAPPAATAAATTAAHTAAPTAAAAEAREDEGPKICFLSLRCLLNWSTFPYSFVIGRKVGSALFFFLPCDNTSASVHGQKASN